MSTCSSSYCPRSAFTLIELLVVVTILALLAALLLPAVSSVVRTSDRAQARERVHAVAQALEVYALSEDTVPDPDDGSFLHYDPSIGGDPADWADYDDWPVLNKLKAKSDLSYPSSALRPVAGGAQRRLVDPWDQPIRYIVGDATDDRGHTPQGLFPDWNAEPDTGAPREVGFTYVYSYGEDNPDGSDLERWIYNADRVRGDER